MCLPSLQLTQPDACGVSASRAGRGAAGFASPAAWPLLLLVLVHRSVFSKLTPPTCRFTPSCSRYALDALRRYGAIRGGWLAVWRVLRCNPIHRGGYDPLQ
jgi:uncharacterized protein